MYIPVFCDLEGEFQLSLFLHQRIDGVGLIRLNLDWKRHRTRRWDGQLVDIVCMMCVCSWMGLNLWHLHRTSMCIPPHLCDGQRVRFPQVFLHRDRSRIDPQVLLHDNMHLGVSTQRGLWRSSKILHAHNQGEVWIHQGVHITPPHFWNHRGNNKKKSSVGWTWQETFQKDWRILRSRVTRTRCSRFFLVLILS